VEILERGLPAKRQTRSSRNRTGLHPRIERTTGAIASDVRPAEPAKIRLIVVDDHPVVGFGLIGELANEPNMEVVASPLTIEEAIPLIEREKPDVVIADVVFENRPRGLELVDRFGRAPDGPAILLFSNYAPASMVTLALEHGAAGYLTKEASPAELARAIRTVASGAVFVSREILAAARNTPDRPSPRELEIITEIAAGATNKEIAASLGISPRTVETHLERCFARYDLASRAELVALAMREHWLAER
jgi:DNA-binding NarL/FixJ family response regulator